MKAYGSRVVANNRESLAAGAVTLHLQHRQAEDWDIQLQFHCAVSSFSLARCRITAQAKTPVS